MKTKVQQILRYFYAKPWAALLVVVCALIPAVMLCMQLKLMSDFKRLLPQNKPSVVSLNRILDRVGGVGVHEIKIQSDDPESTIAFIEKLVVELKKLPEEYVRIIDYKVDEVKDFFETNKYLYVDQEDLITVEARLRRKIEYEKQKQNPFFFDLEDQEVEFDISDIEDKYKSETKEVDKYYKGYLFSKDRKMAVVLVHPSGATTGTQFSKKLTSAIKKVTQDLKPTSFHPSMTIIHGGKFQKVLDQFQQLIEDMLQTLGICLFFVSLVLYLYFRRLRVIALLTLTLAVGAAWTFAIAQVFIGSLNSQTAFLGSIIIGNGVNSGVFLISRYLELRKAGDTYIDALSKAVNFTYFSTFTAAITTSVAFAALSFSEIQGMSEFGFIGGVGMILCWLATYTVLPAILSISEKVLPMHKDPAKVSSGWSGLFGYLGKVIGSQYRPIVAASLLMLVTSGYLAYSFLPGSLEYDFSNLKNKYEKTQAQIDADERFSSIFGESLNPSIILLDDIKQADGICDIVMHQEDGVAQDQKTIASCKKLQDLVPVDQVSKMASLKKIRKLLADDAVKKIYKKYKTQIDELRATRDYKVIGLADLPDTMKRKYQEKDGSLGKIVFAYSNKQSNINDGRRLIAHTDALTNIKLKDGSVVGISGDYPIFADLLKAIERDGPVVSFLSFFFVTILIILYFRKVKAIAFIVGNLALATLIMFGIQSIFEIKLNFFNYIALPVTFGIGVDYAVNLFQRYKQEGKGKILRALETTGGAIILCSMTTMIGYLSLTQGLNQALASFGWLAFIGEVSCILIGLLIVPTYLYIWDRKKAA